MELKEGIEELKKLKDNLEEYNFENTGYADLFRKEQAIDIVLKELEYYKDIIGALSEYYSITIDDIEECIKKDR